MPQPTTNYCHAVYATIFWGIKGNPTITRPCRTLLRSVRRRSRLQNRRGVFRRAFIAAVKVYPDDERLEVQMRKIPASALPKPGSSSVGLVAGARYDRVQRNSLTLTVHMTGQNLMVDAAA